MGIVSGIYKKMFLTRYDKDEAIPYYSAGDFPGLKCLEDTFVNSEGVSISYFNYHYDGFDERRLILFCPGMGPGHTAYLSEIEMLCRAGYRVLTLDYTGCGASGGERMTSVNAPARDCIELLEKLDPQEEVIVVGHSLGGYTALTVANVSEKIRKAVILSGFVSISDEMMGIVRFRFLADRVKVFEKKNCPRYGSVDNAMYLKNTDDRILWIHSVDDPMVNYRYNAGQVEKIGNKNVTLITMKGKRHNPQYTMEALSNMNSWIGEYNRKVRAKEFGSLKERKAFFDDKPIGEMTALDSSVTDLILKFIDE